MIIGKANLVHEGEPVLCDECLDDGMTLKLIAVTMQHHEDVTFILCKNCISQLLFKLTAEYKKK